MIKGVIFDVDGVLLDSMYIWNDLGKRMLLKMGIEPEENLSEILFSMSMEQGSDYMRERYNLKLSVDEIMGMITDNIREFYFYEVQPKAGVMELLEYFKKEKVKMIAATSSPKPHIKRALERTGIRPYLEGILTTSELNTSKHSPLIFIKAAEIIGSEVENTLVFEDSLYALKSAKAEGFTVVGIYDENGEKNQEDMKKTADIYLNSPADYPKK